MIVDIRRFSVEEYYRMAETGILDPDERIELLAGQIIPMSPKGTAHEAAIARLDKILRTRLGEQVLLRFQSPIRLDPYSEPEPDIAVVVPDPLFYEHRHPIPQEIYLIIEVADINLERDTIFKTQLYAESGIRDYWVLDVSDRRVYVFREASETGYQSQAVLSETETLSPLEFTTCNITVEEMLQPV